MTRARPYIHAVSLPQTPVESGMFGPLGVIYKRLDGYHALFAARAAPEPYEMLAKRKWGWLERDFLDEVLDRQVRLIASLQYSDARSVSPNPHQRTVALRYLSSPSTQRVDVILVGKVFAPEPEQARALAMDWYEEIDALIPRDYELFPIETEEAFLLESGQQFLHGISSPAHTTEVRRFEMFLPRPPGQEVTEAHYVVYPFLWHRHGMEQVWQVMASALVPAIVSVSLRPAYLYEAEQVHLAQFYETAIRLTQSEHPAERILGELTAGIYSDYLRSWQQPFLVRIQLVAFGQVPGALARAVGCALSYGASTDRKVPFPGYELVVPSVEECTIARDNVCLLEMSDWGADQAAPPYRRFRYLTDVQGAHCTFRFPFVPKGGIPGVLIESSTRYEPTDLGGILRTHDEEAAADQITGGFPRTMPVV